MHKTDDELSAAETIFLFHNCDARAATETEYHVCLSTVRSTRLK